MARLWVLTALPVTAGRQAAPPPLLQHLATERHLAGFVQPIQAARLLDYPPGLVLVLHSEPLPNTHQDVDRGPGLNLARHAAEQLDGPE